MTVSQKYSPKVADFDYLLNNAVWRVKLSNGEEATDNHIEKCWLKLKGYCEENRLHITNMSFSFRKNRIDFPPDQQGYYFVKGIIGYFGGAQKSYFVGGYVEDKIIKCEKWNLPELTFEEKMEREIESNYNLIIWKRKPLFNRLKDGLEESINALQK